MADMNIAEYILYEAVPSAGTQDWLNALAEQGYEVVAVTPAGQDDLRRQYQLWTLRLQARLRPPGPPVNQPLVNQLASAAITLEAKFDRLSTGLDGVLSVLVRRLEALEAWRLETELHLPRPESDDEGRWLPGAGIALPRATEPDVDATKANGRVRRGENAPE